MAIQGEFRDGGLTSIVQMMCLEGCSLGLFVERSGDEGAIFFELGEIVHATMGRTDGEEAVYQMLSWSEGTFSTNEQAAAPRHTIKTSWDSLLLEGQYRLDEHKRALNAPVAG
jgi:hypothetical protein